MSKLERYLHHFANILVGGTGLVYGWMLYFATPSDVFSVWNHPWQGAFHDLHLLLAPLLVLAVGALWQSHIKARLHKGILARRRSGFGMLYTFLPMTFSGYLLQVTVEEQWRNLWLWIHLLTATLWMTAYAFHWLAKRPQMPQQTI
jgi:hypothetical protein